MRPGEGRRQAWRRVAWYTLLALGCAFASEPATALVLLEGPAGVDELLRAPLQALGTHRDRTLLLRPGASRGGVRPPGFALYDRGQLSFAEAVQALVHEQLASPVLRLAPAAPAERTASGGRSADYHILAGPTPLCGYQVRAHQLADLSAFILGTLPDVDQDAVVPELSQWPDLTLARAQALRTVEGLSAAAGQRDAVSAGAASRCLFVRAGKLLPVWSMKVYAGSIPHLVMADEGEVLRLERQAFSAFTAEAEGAAYPRSAAAGEVTTVPLSGLDGSGYLVSQYLATLVESPVVPAVAADGQFFYQPNDPRFAEVASFVHASAHFRWLQDLGFRWWQEPSPLLIRLHAYPGGTPDNALFTPGSSDDQIQPMIQIGDGDGIELQNLALDGDVVAHEFGHNVIFKTLQSVTGESLVLHEGLADSLVFFRTGDACLGRTICPQGGAICWTPTCLRTALNEVQYGDEQWQAWTQQLNGGLGHKHGQLISGMLWDLIKDHRMSATDVASLTLKAISFFKLTSGFCDFTAALFAADQELFAGAHAEDLTKVLTGRGMQSFLPPQACSDDQPLRPRSASSSTSTASGGSSSSRAQQLAGCGTIGSGGTHNLWLLTLLLLPLMVPGLPLPTILRRPWRAGPPLVRFGLLASICVMGSAATNRDGGETMASDHAKASNGASADGAASQTPSLSSFGRVRLLTSVAWEGRALSEPNLAALRNFRARFKDLTVLHMLSPAYFTKTGAAAEATRAQLRSVMRPQDQVVLLLAGWRSFVTSAGVIYRQGPTFWRETPVGGDCEPDCGLDVPLNVYPAADLDKLFKTGLDTLAAQGFGRPQGVAIEGWMASPHVLEAARRAGMNYDFSAVAPELLTRVRRFPLYDWVHGLWTEITPHSQPFGISTTQGSLLEVPQSLASMDYLATQDVVAIFREYAERWHHDPSVDLVFPLVVYQETAMRSLPMLEKALQEVFAYAAEHQVALEPMDLPALRLPAAEPARTLAPGLVPELNPEQVSSLPVAH